MSENAASSKNTLTQTWDFFVGIDVAKEKLDVVLLPGGEHRSFQNQAEGYQQFLQWIQARGVCLLILVLCHSLIFG